MKFLINLFNRRASAELTSEEFMDFAEVRRRAEVAQEAAFAAAASDLGEASAKFHRAVLRGDTRGQSQHHNEAKRIRRKIMEMEGLG